MSNLKRVLVYGGKGALGSTCIKVFQSNNWWAASIDLHPNEEANANVIIKAADSWIAQEAEVVDGVKTILEGNKVDAILCVAGGWADGSSASEDFLKNTDLMIKQSVWSSGIAAKLAATYLKDGGLLTLTGAKAALDATPEMIGYGLAKSAVHQLTKSLAAPTSGLPDNGCVLCILPVTLDTPINRKFEPKGDFSTWTPLDFVADLSLKWASGENRPDSGSLMQLITTDGKTDLVKA